MIAKPYPSTKQQIKLVMFVPLSKTTPIIGAVFQVQENLSLEIKLNQISLIINRELLVVNHQYS